MENQKAKTEDMTDVTLVMPNTEALGKLESAVTGMSLTIKYKKQEDWVAGEPIRCFFMGLKEVPNEEGEKVICAGFMSKTETFIAGQMVLVDSVRGLAKGTPLEITFEGKKKNSTSQGSTNIFTVKTLNLG